MKPVKAFLNDRIEFKTWSLAQKNLHSELISTITKRYENLWFISTIVQHIYNETC